MGKPLPNIHTTAICEADSVGEGTRIHAYAHIFPGARIGRGCDIGENVHIERGVTVGDGCIIRNGTVLSVGTSVEDRVFIGPGVVVTKDRTPRAFIPRNREEFPPTRIRTGASIGANSTLVSGVTVGRYAMVGAGSVVTKDVAPHALVAGNPATASGRVCFCGLRLLEKTICPVEDCPIPEHTLGDPPEL